MIPKICHAICNLFNKNLKLFLHQLTGVNFVASGKDLGNGDVACDSVLVFEQYVSQAGPAAISP